MVLKLLIVLHRWLGVALCVLFLLWFPSGIGMMYWGMPSVSTQDRLDHMPPLRPETIALSPEEAARKIGQNASPSQVRLNSFIWMYSPARKYRLAGAPTSIPYRGQKRWHTILGLVFGMATVTWTFSGSLAFLPFPPPQEAPPTQAQNQRPTTQNDGQRNGQGRSRGQGRQRGGNASLASALRGQVSMKDFAGPGPKDVLTKFGDLHAKELSFTSFAGLPLYSLTIPDGSSRLISLDGQIVTEFDQDKVIGINKKNVPDPAKLELRTLDRYDAYYQDREQRKPLPVIMALTHDPEGTRYYIDPRSASVVGSYTNSNWVNRWL